MKKVLRGETGEDAKKKLPQIIIIIDELADLMMVAPEKWRGRSVVLHSWHVRRGFI